MQSLEVKRRGSIRRTDQQHVSRCHLKHTHANSLHQIPAPKSIISIAEQGGSSTSTKASNNKCLDWAATTAFELRAWQSHSLLCYRPTDRESIDSDRSRQIGLSLSLFLSVVTTAGLEMAKLEKRKLPKVAETTQNGVAIFWEAQKFAHLPPLVGRSIITVKVVSGDRESRALAALVRSLAGKW